MRTLILTIVVTGLFFSCSVDEDANRLPVDSPLLLQETMTALQQEANYSVFTQQLIARGKDVALENNAIQYTVFVPTNTAFTLLLVELGVSSVSDIPTTLLDSVLDSHIIVGQSIDEQQFTDGYTMNTLSGDTLLVNIAGTGGTTITDGAGRETLISNTDYRSRNAFIHTINRVLLPN